jgi:hypothetical protein
MVKKYNIIFWSGTWEPSSPLKNKFCVRPMAAYQLSHWMRSNGFKCQVIDFIQHLSVEDLLEFTEPFISKDVSILALCTNFWQQIPFKVPDNILTVLSILKDRYPNLKVIGGGHFVNFYKEIDFDKSFSGYSEDSLLAWCAELAETTDSFIPFDITKCSHTYHESDCIMPNETIPMELGRGCMFKCLFCSYPHIGKKKGTYIKNHNLIKDSIKYNLDFFNTANYIFVDDTCNEDQDKMKCLADVNNEIGYKLNWTGFNRADLVWSHQNHKTLFDSGLTQTFFGLESFHPMASKVIGKSWSGSHAKNWLPYLHDVLWEGKVGTEGSFIIGLPYETVESIRNTANWIKTNNFFRGYFNGYDLNSRYGYTSAFERDSEKYGYKIDQDRLWTNEKCPDNIDGIYSKELANSLNKELKSVWKLRGFYTGSFSNLGYSKEDILNANWSDNGKMFDSKIDNFIETYKTLFKNNINKNA